MEVIKRNAVPKLLPTTRNLIVTTDDMFVSIIGMPHLEHRFGEWFAKPEFRNIGGILFLRPYCSLGPDEVLIRFEENRLADPSNRLPGEVIGHLKAQAAIDDKRRLDRLLGWQMPVRPSLIMP
jgi:hypothetical protein